MKKLLETTSGTKKLKTAVLIEADVTAPFSGCKEPKVTPYTSILTGLKEDFYHEGFRWLF